MKKKANFFIVPCPLVLSSFKLKNGALKKNFILLFNQFKICAHSVEILHKTGISHCGAFRVFNHAWR